MGIGAYTLDDAGSVTAPTDALGVVLGSADSTLWAHGLPIKSIDVPFHPAVVLMNGVDPVRIHIEGATYRLGGIPVKAAITATPSGTQATALLDLGTSSYNPSDGDQLFFGNAVQSVVFKAILSASPVFIEVLIGATVAATIDNINFMIDGSGGVEGVNYQDSGQGHLASMRATWEVINQPDTESIDIREKAFGGSQAIGFVSGAWTNCDFDTADGDSAPDYVVVSGTSPTGDDPAAGTYGYIAQGLREVDGALTGATPSAEAETGTAGQINLTAITANADTTFDFTRWSRSLVDQQRFYRAADIARAGTTDTDDFTDARLLKGSVIYRPEKFRAYRAGHIPRYRCGAAHHGRIFMAGGFPSSDYTAGTAAVTITTDGTDNDTVTISNGYPQSDWEGRYFIVDSTAEEYLILSVDVTNAILTLDRGYEGATNASASYTIRDKRDLDEIAFTEVNLPNQLPATNSVSGVISKAGKGIVALTSIWESLIAHTDDGVWRMDGTSPQNYTLRPVASAPGLVGTKAITDVNGTLYWLSREGIMQWVRGGLPENVTRPRGRPSGINGTIQRINWAHGKWAHMHYDETTEVLRCFVPLDDEVVPGHAIRLDLQTGTFAVDRVPDVTAAATVFKSNGDPVTVYSTLTGELIHAGISNSDGAYGFEPKTTATAATVRTWTDSGASFPTAGDGLAGVPFWGLDADGDWFRAIIASNTGTVLTFTRDLDTAFAIGDEGYVGGILGHMRTGRGTSGVGEEDHSITTLDWMFSPDVDGKGIVAAAKDQDSLALLPWSQGQIDLTETDGHRLLRWGGRGKMHQFEIYLPEPGCDPHILGIGVGIQARRKAKVRIG